MPPRTVPIAIPTIGSRPTLGISGLSATAARIVATLNIAGESDGTKNRRSEFSMPIIAAATASVVRNGSMIRVRSVVSSSLPGTAAKFGTNQAVICGAITTPMMTSTIVTRTSAFITRLPTRKAASLPCVVSVRVKVGTKAAVIAPSAKRSRNRLGMRNATLNASICMLALAPNMAASTVSRTTPRTRLAAVAAPIRPADFASRELMS